MYSRLALITNEIVGLGSEEMTDRSIIKKILRALDGKYDIVCTLIQMRPKYNDLKPRKSLEELLLMICHSRIRKSFTTSQVVLTKPHVMLLHHQSEKETFNEELSLMVKNFNKFYKSRSKERSSKSRSYNDKRSSSRERNCYNCGRSDTIPMSVRLPTKEEKIHPKG